MHPLHTCWADAKPRGDHPLSWAIDADDLGARCPTIAHLAGALGVPVRAMLMHSTDWRWNPVRGLDL